MIEFREFLEYCQIEAIANKVNPTDVSMYREMCRRYSKMFHTPLHLVETLDPEHVLLNIYEEQLEDTDLENFQKLEHLLDIIRGIEDPEYNAAQSKEQAEVDKKAELEEEERIKSGRAVHPTLQKALNEKTLLKKVKEEIKEKPTRGFINLDYLSKHDSEG